MLYSHCKVCCSKTFDSKMSSLLKGRFHDKSEGIYGSLSISLISVLVLLMYNFFIFIVKYRFSSMRGCWINTAASKFCEGNLKEFLLFFEGNFGQKREKIRKFPIFEMEALDVATITTHLSDKMRNFQHCCLAWSILTQDLRCSKAQNPCRGSGGNQLRAE